MNKKAKIIWITGASTGIGAALAQKMAQRGNIVAVTARSVETLQNLAAQSYVTGKIIAYPADVTDATATEQVIQSIINDYGRIDCAILNAGSHKPEKGLDLRYETVKELFELNFFSVVRCALSLIPLMRNNGGHIAFTASVAGYRGLPNAATYCASKAALISMAESLRPAAEVADIKLQLICPGFVKTPLTDKNDFPMPFLISVNEAADSILRGLASNRFEIVFPWPMLFLMKFLRLLPYASFLPLMRAINRAQKP